MSSINQYPLSKLMKSLAVMLTLTSLTVSAIGGSVEHVIIVGVDGMSPNGVITANTPVMHQLMKEGAFTMHARGVMPTSSSPNWASMIMGAGPEQHGVTSNEWQTNKFEIPPVVVGPGGIFPTIFSVLHEQRPASESAVFHDWSDFGRLVEQNAPKVIVNPKGPTNTMVQAIAYWKQHKPTFLFVHLDHVDHAGHHDGHGTPEYYAAVESADRLIGDLIQAVKDSGEWESTVFLVTADHGGKGKGHGGATLQEIEIPWIIRGPGVIPDHEIKTPVNTYDTACTVAYIFKLTPPECWIGKPVKEAFINPSEK
jgi:predicted AlkP superfamily pyrophosphatase or phosphodiesterase